MHQKKSNWKRGAAALSMAALLLTGGLPVSAAPEEDPDPQEVYEEAEDLTPEQSRAAEYFAQGEDFFLKGYWNEALDAYTKSILLDPMVSPVHAQRAEIYIRQGEQEHRQAADEVLTGKARELYEKAAADYADAAALNSENLRAQLGLAMTLTELDRFEEALAAFDTVIKAKPDNYAVYDARARLYIDRGDYENALKDLDKARDLHPKDRMNDYYRGIICAKQGQWQEALGHFDRAPRMALAWLQKGRVLEQMGRPAEALLAYGEFLSRDRVNNKYTRDFVKERMKNIRLD